LAQQDLEEAREAKSILQSKVFDKAFEECRLDYLNAFLTTDPDEPEKRERIYFSVRTLNNVKANLIRFINAGDLERGR